MLKVSGPIGGLQALLKAYYSSEMLWLLDQPLRVKCAYLGRCLPSSDPKAVHAALVAAGGRVEPALEAGHSCVSVHS